MSPRSKTDNFSLHLPAPAGARDVPLDMVFVHGGAFRMGSDKNTPGAYADEKPAHDVALPHFFIGKYPVTQALWKAVMQGENPSFFQGDDRPVETVSWDDIHNKFLPELNRLLPGFGFRLPTEAEWEYAARGGSRNSAGTASGHRSNPFHNTPSSAVSLPFTDECCLHIYKNREAVERE
ncbi:MAG: SUMF1/EgtB/PvdO family nonheme iron enzyme [Saprospirales bacterium]|jgi:formylglycine-generating enzyme required for sulfatase activity|nr:SUMF1/EgtB/PvdO family nonheme iron enzyme [Saprospirales bacterium]